MTTLLFPGRHLLNTAFQVQYLNRVLQVPLSQLDFWEGRAPEATAPVNQVVFAVTSCNQQYSRYNPIPFYVRAIGVDRFARPLEMTYAITYRIIGIPHYAPTPRFARYVLREIGEQTEGELSLAPDNCVVLCSTPAVIEMYAQLGFSILPAELELANGLEETPIELLKQLVEAGDAWFTQAQLRQKVAPSTFDLWQDFPDIPRRVQRLWRDPLLNEVGSLTEERNYAIYAYDMGNKAIIELKYRDISRAILPGKIVDEGCADGALLSLIAHDFPDSDLIGIEITGEFMARCQERQRSGDFGGAFIHFHQRNITQPLFEDSSISTTICNSTVHELWSYGRQADAVREYLAQKYRQTIKGGRLIIRDVIGPEEKDQLVHMKLAEDDGSSEHIFQECASQQELAEHLGGLSTWARFKRFARDFLAEQRAEGRRSGETQFSYEETTLDGQHYFVLTLQAAAEFMSKKDYVDNWRSEMNEEFAFWSFSEWKQALAAAGFRIIENPNDPESGSRAYTNDWIVENRFRDKVALFKRDGDGRLQPMAYPVTNVVLVAEKSGDSAALP